jgi:hypothetical protein
MAQRNQLRSALYSHNTRNPRRRENIAFFALAAGYHVKTFPAHFDGTFGNGHTPAMLLAAYIDHYSITLVV